MDQESSYKKCKEHYLIRLDTIDKKKIDSLLQTIKNDEKAILCLKNNLPKKHTSWSTIFKLHYDIVRQLADILLTLSFYKSENHVCVFAYLSKHYKELSDSWTFFEAIRKKRNSILYYGDSFSYKLWQQIEPEFIVLISTIRLLVKNHWSID